MSQRLRNLILVTELRSGYRDVRLFDYVGPHILVYDRGHRVAIRIVDLPHWVKPACKMTTPEFLRGFSSLYKEALLYLLEDAQPVPEGQELPECTFKHLTQLAEFLKETN